MSFIASLGTHAAFIVAAYITGLVVVIGLIVWVAADYAAQKRLIRDLEQQGVTRRSQGATKGS